MEQNEILVETVGLTKYFEGSSVLTDVRLPTPSGHIVTEDVDDSAALNDVNVSIPSGRIVGLLGPNGSGKSTLLRHIVGLYLPSRGVCKTFGTPSDILGPKELQRLGYVHQEGELIDYMTAERFLAFLSAHYPTWNFGLQGRLTRKLEVEPSRRIGVMSPGERQKLAIIAAVSYEPDLLLLDEPAAALDPVARASVMNFLLEVIQNPRRTILISSHILSDIEKVADHVIIMNHGRVMHDSSLDAWREEYIQIEITAADATILDSLPSVGIVEQKRIGNQMVVIVRAHAQKNLIEAARAAGASSNIRALPLEEIYRVAMSDVM